MKGLKKKTPGKSGIEVTRLGLGCAPRGGLYGDIPEERTHEVVRRVLSWGINLIDTAPRPTSIASRTRAFRWARAKSKAATAMGSRTG
jgi:predicted aldo/keto reductase-like oxidoreductase